MRKIHIILAEVLAIVLLWATGQAHAQLEFVSPIHLIFVSEVTGNFGVYYTDGSMTNPVPILVPTEPQDNITSVACSPTGDTIAVNLYGGQITLVDLLTNTLTDLPLERSRYDNLEFSPNGQQLTFTRGVSGDIFALDLNDLELQQVSSVAGQNDFATWSPDGNRIAFANVENGLYTLYVKDLTQSGSETPILTSSNSPYWSLEWSPLGNEIAFDLYAPNSSVYTIEPVMGSSPTPLFQSPQRSYGSPMWSTNADQLAFTATIDGEPELYYANRDGTNVHRLTFNGIVWDEAQCWLEDAPTILGLR